MDFMTSIKTVFGKYVAFSGRAQRSEFWWFMLFIVIANGILSQVDTAIFGPTMVITETSMDYNMGYLGMAFSIATFLPSLGVAIRRLHDIDKSGWALLFGLIPLIGFIMLLVWYAKPGTSGDNRFGADQLA